jgi:hypothetical protein
MFWSKDVAPENMASMVVAFLGFHPESSWLKAVAFSKSDDMSLTEDTSHAFMRPSNWDAATNISAIVVTADVSQPSRSWLYDEAR